jgi:hypothetical protein
MSHHKPQYTQHEHEIPDSWHRHIPAEEGAPQEEHGKTNPLLLGIAFVGSLAFVGGTIAATWLYFKVHITALRRERIESAGFAREFFDPQKGIQAKALADLNSHYFASETAAREGKASVPIEQGIQKVVARYGSSASK